MLSPGSGILDSAGVSSRRRSNSLSTTTSNQPSSSHAHAHVQTPKPIDAKEEAERAALINEILRLEKSMNVALRASHDEISSLKESSAKKRAEIKRMEDELTKVLAANKNTDNNSNNNNGHNEDTTNTKNINGGGMRMPFPSPGGSDIRRNRNLMNLQNSLNNNNKKPFFRRPSLKDAGDRKSMRQFFRRPSMKGDELLRESLSHLERGNGDPGSLSSSSYHPSSCEGTSYTSNNNSNEEEEEDDDQAALYREYKANQLAIQQKQNQKKNQLALLQNQHCSNKSQLSYLQSRLTSIQNQSKARTAQHSTIMDGLTITKDSLTKKIERREQLIDEVEKSLNAYEEKIDSLENEIEEKTNRYEQYERDVAAGYDNQSTDIKQLQNKLQTYQLRLQIHSRYTSKALQSFIDIIETAKKNDTEGVLLPTSGEVIFFDENDREKLRKKLVEEIASDVDKRLDHLDIMIKEVDAMTKEYRLLSSSPSSMMEFGIESTRTSDTATSDSTQQHPNNNTDLLSVSKECTAVLEDFISCISQTLEYTAQTAPSSSIEFQEEDGTKKKQQQKSSNDAALSKREAEKIAIQSAIQEEKRRHNEVLRKLQIKLESLTEQLSGEDTE